ncbi:MAG: hypothetical protein AAF724_03315 [Pseudomonadota bacterium]
MRLSSLDGVYPEGSFLAPRLRLTDAKWMPSDLHTIEFMSGNLIACAGDFPMLVHKAAMSPDGLGIMADCGVEVGTAIEVYDSPQHYDSMVRRRIENGEKAAFVYPEEAMHLDNGASLIDTKCLEYLNNKDHIEALAGAQNVPGRRTIRINGGIASQSFGLPIVLKIATDEPNAGGLDVAVCRKNRQLARAIERFSGAEKLIAEDYIDAVQNWCIQFVVLPDGAVKDFGASQQVCMRNGLHAGNLLTFGEEPPANTVRVGRAIAQEGSRLGYCGVCGFDFLIDRRGKGLVIDLNFRPVSSTAFVIEAIRRRNPSGEPRHARLAFCTAKEALPRMIQLCRDGFDEGWLIPLATFDPHYGDLEPGPARLRLMILAHDLKTLRKREQRLASRGIDFFPLHGGWEAFKQRFAGLI